MSDLDPENFIAGENVTHLAKSGRRGGIVVSVRFDSEDAEQLCEFADKQGRRLTEVVRYAVSAYLNAQSLPFLAVICDESGAVVSATTTNRAYERDAG